MGNKNELSVLGVNVHFSLFSFSALELQARVSEAISNPLIYPFADSPLQYKRNLPDKLLESGKLMLDKNILVEGGYNATGSPVRLVLHEKIRKATKSDKTVFFTEYKLGVCC